METVTIVFGKRVRWARKLQGLSQAQLADLATDLGQPMDNTIVSRIEAGHRSVGMGEFLVLSALLGLRLEEAVTPLDSAVERVALGDGETSQSASVAELAAWTRGASSMFGNPWVSESPPNRPSPLGDILRSLAGEAARAGSASEELDVAEAGIAVLRGAVPALKISARREAKGAEDGTR